MLLFFSYFLHRHNGSTIMNKSQFEVLLRRWDLIIVYYLFIWFHSLCFLTCLWRWRISSPSSSCRLFATFSSSSFLFRIFNEFLFFVRSSYKITLLIALSFTLFPQCNVTWSLIFLFQKEDERKTKSGTLLKTKCSAAHSGGTSWKHVCIFLCVCVLTGNGDAISWTNYAHFTL